MVAAHHGVAPVESDEPYLFLRFVGNVGTHQRVYVARGADDGRVGLPLLLKIPSGKFHYGLYLQRFCRSHPVGQLNLLESAASQSVKRAAIGIDKSASHFDYRHSGGADT